MKTLQSPFRSFAFHVAGIAALTLAAFAGLTPAAHAGASRVQLPNRIAGPIDNASRAPLPGSTSPRAMRSTDLGAIDPHTPLTGISLTFSRSAAQVADLDQLIAAQQNPASPLYHQWLTPAQFGARFGVSDSDLATTESWLQSQGFSIVAVSPSRDRITFSGTAASVESAFGAPLHYFRATSGSMIAAADALTHVAPAHDLTLPAALGSIVLAVGNLSDYHPQSHAIKRPSADFTSSISGSHYLSPKDVATIYDLNAAYSAGYFGSGQTIVVAGETAVVPADIAAFQAAAGVATNTPNYTLIPNTGSSAIFTGDEAESDLDLEYTSSIASKATIDFLYTGNSPYYGIFDAFIYAIQNQIGTIITISYGECEPDLQQTYYNQYEAYLKQAATQGQTVINSSGDDGSTGCYQDTGNSTAYRQQVAVSYPSSSAYVTGLGGTEFPATATAASNSTYFTAANGTDVIGSALSYIPEQAWNDDSTSGLSSGGGGVSIYTPRPSWQAGVTGIPSGSFRLTPDISLDSSPNDAGYLYCSSDTGSDGVGFSGSCTNGFRVSSAYSNANGLTIAGGTSFAAPIFAGMLAILNQAKGFTAGQGLINPTLYTLASNASTYASAFHDITSGGNQCLAGSTICGTGAATTSYATTTGYDLATGLGSIDLYKLIQAWPSGVASTSGLLSSTVAATPNSYSPAVSSSDAITLQVNCASGSLCTGATPTGTLTVTDIVAGTSTTLSPVTLSGGAAAYTYAVPSTGGVHQVIFTYSGDSVYAPSKATVILDAGSAAFTLSAPTVSVSSGSTITNTITITPTNGYKGTVNLNLYSPTISSACYSGPASVSITGTTAVTATYTIYTGVSACASGAAPLRRAGTSTAANAIHPQTPASPESPWHTVPATAAFAGLLALGCFKRRSRLLRAGLALAFVVALGLSGLGLTGCSNSAPGASSGSGGTTSSSYTVTVSGTDSVDSAVSTSTTFTLTVN